jgi:hypothetical protein
MATLTLEVPDEILTHLTEAGHSPQEILLTAIVQLLAAERTGLTSAELIHQSSLPGNARKPPGLQQPSAGSHPKRRKAKLKTREDVYAA